jgi:16S rRNA (guanine966-N2)-methyltransferase
MAKKPRAGSSAGMPPPGRLRIVAGKWRRRLIPVVAVEGLRPTPARVRETLFNWLASRIDNAHCLDLCAGTGALGLEALSRGAATATFVEKSPIAARALRDVCRILAAEHATVHQADAIAFLNEQPPTARNIVFIDPPYASDLQTELCRLLDLRGWLAVNAMIYIEQDRRSPDVTLPAGWQTIHHKTAGDVRYSLLTARHAGSEAESI